MLHSDYSKSTCLRLRPMYMEPDQSIAWAGFKKFASTINEAAAAFGPLKSLAGEFPGFIENLDKIASGWDDYGELRAELNELFEDMSNYLTGPVSPIITPSIASLAQ
ncbi:hypothetical protein FRC07_015092 [Ceratobasidium sp. 392]|nr:hypothetical protein FRC07_015092 [Ceratobasidium sp. 392]